MTNHARIPVLFVSGFATLVALPGCALDVSECRTRYEAARAAGTLNGQKWNDFRKAQCGSEATANPAAPCVGPMPVGNAIFPSAVDPKYAKENPGKARMHTCIDQYNANKSNNGNGGMKWIEMKWIGKGGGYYRECNNRLKG